MARELRLKYFIDLVSRVGQSAQSDARLVETAQRRVDAAIGRQIMAVRQLDGTFTFVGRNTAIERQVGYLQRLGQAADAARDRMRRLGEMTARGGQIVANRAAAVLDKAPEAAMATGAAYYGARRLAGSNLTAFSELEAATSDLKITMMDASGKVSNSFDKVVGEAMRLGDRLPGTTADFMRAARALKEQGMADSAVARGGLRAASYFGVATTLDQYASATTVAKMREAFNLQDAELPKMADQMWRAKTAYGLDANDFRMTAAYAAPTYNALGLTGLDNVRKLFAVQGMAASVGLEGSSFGTNFADMLNRLNQVDSRMGRNTQQARLTRSLMSEAGIELEFFSDKGTFMGIENMLKQLTKLRALNPSQQMTLLNQLFGTEGARPAQILVTKGEEAYRAALEKADNTVSLDKAIDEKMTTFASKLESLGGTITNVQASIGTQAGKALKPVMDGATILMGKTGEFISAHPSAGTAVLAGEAVLGGYAAMRGMGYVKNLMQGRAGLAPVAGGAAGAATVGGAEAAAAASSGISTTARLARMLKWGGATAAIGFGLEATSILADEKADKSRELTRAGLTTGVGLLGGVAAGAAAGSVVPGIGTLIGAIAGGIAASYGSGAIFDALWEKTDPSKHLKGKDGALSPFVFAGGMPELQVGAGVLQVDVRLTRDGAISSVQQTVVQQPSLVKINPGNTNPGSLVLPAGSW